MQPEPQHRFIFLRNLAIKIKRNTCTGLEIRVRLGNGRRGPGWKPASIRAMISGEATLRGPLRFWIYLPWWSRVAQESGESEKVTSGKQCKIALSFLV